jgi:methylene-fatty-acyl-phospholipid synthase
MANVKFEMDMSMVFKYTALFVVSSIALPFITEEDVWARTLSQPSAIVSILVTLASPVFWNLIPRYGGEPMIKAFGSRRIAMLAFAIYVMVTSFYREVVFVDAIEEDPVKTFNIFKSLDAVTLDLVTDKLGWAVTIFGLVLSSSAMYRLGIFGRCTCTSSTWVVAVDLPLHAESLATLTSNTIGTYMGEFFGVMLREKITSFPFSHFNNPSTSC